MTPLRLTGLAAALLAGAAAAADGTEVASLTRPAPPGPILFHDDLLRARLLRLGSIAESILVPETRTVARTPSFRVQSDLSDPAVAEKIARNMEATWAVLDGIFGSRPAPGPGSERTVLVFLYGTRAQYEALCRRISGNPFGKAFYSRPGLIALHAEAFSREDLLSTLLHEGAHAYIDRFVARPGHPFPPWLNEGLAEYLASSEVRDGRLVPGVSSPLRLYHAPHGVFRGRSRQHSAAILLRRALRRGEALPLPSLVEAGSETFTGPARDVVYPQASLLVHFLRHGRPGWGGEAFPRLVRAAAEGVPADSAFQASYGVAPADLERDFRRYVRRF